MGRGGREQGQTRASGLLYGRSRRGSGPQTARQTSINELLDFISGQEGGRGDLFFAGLGLVAGDCSVEPLHYNEGRDLQERHLSAYHCTVSAADTEIGSLEYWCEPGSPDKHIFTLEKRSILGPPHGAEKRLFAGLASLDGPGEKMIEINIKPYDDLDRGWMKELQVRSWSIADSELRLPLKDEEEIIEEFSENHFQSSPANNLRDIVRSDEGYAFLDYYARSGLLYVRTSLDSFAAES